MGITTEKRLAKLEDEIKALKSTYTIYGGLVKTYLSMSQWFDVGDVNQEFRFKADFVNSGKILVASAKIEIMNSNGTIYSFPNHVLMYPQSGDGSIIIRFPGLGIKNRLTIVSTSPGTFTKIL